MDNVSDFLDSMSLQQYAEHLLDDSISEEEAIEKAASMIEKSDMLGQDVDVELWEAVLNTLLHMTSHHYSNTTLH